MTAPSKQLCLFTYLHIYLDTRLLTTSRYIGTYAFIAVYTMKPANMFLILYRQKTRVPGLHFCR